MNQTRLEYLDSIKGYGHRTRKRIYYRCGGGGKKPAIPALQTASQACTPQHGPGVALRLLRTPGSVSG